MQGEKNRYASRQSSVLICILAVPTYKDCAEIIRGQRYVPGFVFSEMNIR